MMSSKQVSMRKGFTLIEVSVSILLVTTIVLALMNVRYHAHRHAVRADVYSTASRLSLLLLESWRSSTAVDAFDPLTDFSTTGEITISTSGSGPSVPSGFTSLGVYHMSMGNRHFYATLAYIDETTTDPAKLYVCIGWNKTYAAGYVSSDAIHYNLTTYH